MDGAIVIDNGSEAIKIGFAGEDATDYIVESVVGEISQDFIYDNRSFSGDEVLDKIGAMNFVRPIQGGIVKDWEGMEKLWAYIFFNKLEGKAAGKSVTLTEPPLNPVENREKQWRPCLSRLM